MKMNIIHVILYRNITLGWLHGCNGQKGGVVFEAWLWHFAARKLRGILSILSILSIAAADKMKKCKKKCDFFKKNIFILLFYAILPVQRFMCAFIYCFFNRNCR